MPQGLQAFAVLLVLLPGFLSARIVQMLCARPKQTELDKVVEALVFSFFTYLLFSLSIGPELPLSWSTTVQQEVTHYSLDIRRGRLALLTAYAIILGFAWSWIVNHDALVWLRKGGFTQPSSRSSVWNDIFHVLRGTVQIQLKDGRMVRGWLRCYSDEPEDSTLFLEAVTWIDAEGNLYPAEGPGTLFTRESGIQFIAFLDDPTGPTERPEA